MKTLLFIISAGFISIVGRYSIIAFDNDISYTNFFMLCNNIGWFCALCAVCTASKNWAVLVIAEAFAILAFGEILDEMFFNPIELQINEAVFLAIMTLRIGWRLGHKE